MDGAGNEVPVSIVSSAYSGSDDTCMIDVVVPSMPASSTLNWEVYYHNPSSTKSSYATDLLLSGHTLSNSHLALYIDEDYGDRNFYIYDSGGKSLTSTGSPVAFSGFGARCSLDRAVDTFHCYASDSLRVTHVDDVRGAVSTSDSDLPYCELWDENFTAYANSHWVRVDLGNYRVDLSYDHSYNQFARVKYETSWGPDAHYLPSSIRQGVNGSEIPYRNHNVGLYDLYAKFTAPVGWAIYQGDISPVVGSWASVSLPEDNEMAINAIQDSAGEEVNGHYWLIIDDTNSDSDWMDYYQMAMNSMTYSLSPAEQVTTTTTLPTIIYPAADGYCYDWSNPPDGVADRCLNSASYLIVGNYWRGGLSRVFMEYPVSGQATLAELCVDYYAKIWLGNAYDILADYYQGNGFVGTGDFDSGTYMRILYPAYSSYDLYCIDVTDGYNSVNNYIGIRLHWSNADELARMQQGNSNYWYMHSMESSMPPYLRVNFGPSTTSTTTTTSTTLPSTTTTQTTISTTTTTTLPGPTTTTTTLPSQCPAGMADAGTYCVDVALTTISGTWSQSVISCYSGGKRLCQGGELIYATDGGVGIVNLTNPCVRTFTDGLAVSADLASSTVDSGCYLLTTGVNMVGNGRCCADK